MQILHVLRATSMSATVKSGKTTLFRHPDHARINIRLIQLKKMLFIYNIEDVQINFLSSLTRGDGMIIAGFIPNIRYFNS